ncbi:MAG: peptide chain release factor RF-3, partial [Pusillimonas sp.]|nr:peptide chain release factor RF-3 [Pusillimonas sp.]
MVTQRASRSLTLLYLFLSLFFSFTIATSAQAGTIWLNNGDRISGTIQSLDGGKLLVKTEYGGNIRIDVNHVKTLESDSELVVKNGEFNNDYRAKLVAAGDGEVTLHGVERANGQATQVNTAVPVTSLTRVVRPTPFLNEATFKGRFDLAATRKSASTKTQDYTLNTFNELRHGMWRHQLAADYTRNKEDSTDSTYNYGAGYTLDYFLSEKAFWQGRASYRRDFVEELNRQVTYGTGPGYQFWDNELGAFSLAALVSRVHYGYTDGSSENAYAASLRWDYVRYFYGKEFELYTRGEVLRPLDGDTKFAINGEVGARYNVNSWMPLYLKYA